MADVFENWSLEFESGIPAYRQIVQRVQAAVAAGLVTAGEQLPTIRALHLKLGVNPNTIARSYRELQLLGLLSAEHGSGCYIAPQSTAQNEQISAKQARLGTLATQIFAEARRLQIEPQELIAYLQSKAPLSTLNPESK